MEKNEFRVLIKHYFLRKKTISQTKAKLDKYYGDSSPSISMVKRWFHEFRCGRTSTEDAERSGRPVEVSTPETVGKIHNMVLADRRLKVREIVEVIGISRGSVFSILNDHLGMRKHSARWVLKQTKDQRADMNEKVGQKIALMRAEESAEERSARLEDGRLQARQSRATASALVRSQRKEREMARLTVSRANQRATPVLTATTNDKISQSASAPLGAAGSSAVAPNFYKISNIKAEPALNNNINSSSSNNNSSSFPAATTAAWALARTIKIENEFENVDVSQPASVPLGASGSSAVASNFYKISNDWSIPYNETVSGFNNNINHDSSSSIGNNSSSFPAATTAAWDSVSKIKIENVYENVKFEE